MRQFIPTALLVAAAVCSMPASAQSKDDPVLMHEAPFHVPIFANDEMIVLRINIPPSRDTGFHTHYADSVSVNLSPAIRTNQNYGEEKITPPASSQALPGRVSFNNVTERGHYTHKATNVGPTPFHNVSFILKGDGARGYSASSRAGVAGYEQVLDNARVRAWRVVLEPGEATGRITQSAPGLRIYVRGGVIDELVPDAAPRGMAPNTGEFIWQDAGQTRIVENTGSTIVEFVEFELK
jgi:hypothetical protein